MPTWLWISMNLFQFHTNYYVVVYPIGMCVGVFHESYFEKDQFFGIFFLLKRNNWSLQIQSPLFDLYAMSM